MTPEILLVLAVLLAAIILFVTGKFRNDINAVIIMLTVGILGLVSPLDTISGFGSNAVISIIGVMILGYGIDRTGIMVVIARKIMEVGESSERKITTVISSVLGLVSAFMQDLGSVALFLPAVLRISRKSKIPKSRLIMPMGFAAILGGTLTMVGSSPLILLNDLLEQDALDPFGFFAVTPIGAALLLSGVLYFMLLGRYVLPSKDEAKESQRPQEELIESWNLSGSMHHYRVTEGSRLNGMKREEANLKKGYSLYLLAITEGDDVIYGPWRYTIFSAGEILTLLGSFEDAERFAKDFGLKRHEDQQGLTEKIGEENAGFAEVILKPRSKLIGKTIREIAFRKNYSLEIIILLSENNPIRDDFSDTPLKTGDTIVVYGPWNRIEAIGKDPNFVLLTPVEEKEMKKGKGAVAIGCFAGGILLSFAGLPISVGLLTGAIAMVLLGVIDMDEAYHAVDWKTVFLLAGLIPLGLAMDQTGTAAYIADIIIQVAGQSHPILLMFAIAILTTFFTLFMSNAAATVLLVPLVIFIGSSTGLDPRGLALLVAVCASNSFILPTHQVNAFLMNRGGYRNSDYIKAGGGMTFLFLVVAVGMVYIMFA
ncbi:TrkA-C domain protein [Methanolacinia petrolearia DSM 11571]|uniref:TrkA-C domain protein n=1 Tax=Methanolacinia petrolearia (strain DSM 11571 / OCM 486 / SEBR 4847) TaxID=679926 RepID=E1RJI9_METP4|nr:SLC13 family permease [Methanolacinia petrolearia]ADN36795.1 TrkA-C domain protein [Methanolacinia petrolearia DSM 11571]